MNNKELSVFVAQCVRNTAESGYAIGAMWKSVLESMRR
jgi:hypothetical protein